MADEVCDHRGTETHWGASALISIILDYSFYYLWSYQVPTNKQSSCFYFWLRKRRVVPMLLPRNAGSRTANRGEGGGRISSSSSVRAVKHARAQAAAGRRATAEINKWASPKCANEKWHLWREELFRIMSSGSEVARRDLRSCSGYPGMQSFFHRKCRF